jgi:KDO2-lipid IV(A) lauroyltransferase
VSDDATRPRSFRRRARDRALGALAVVLTTLARLLPVGAWVRLGEWWGGVALRVDRARRRVAIGNLALAYGGALDEAGRRRVVAAVYRHLGRLLFEYLALAARPGLAPPSRFVRIAGLERARAAVARHGAAIFITPHQGHWELLGGAISERIAPLHAVMRPLRHPSLNRRLVAFRQRLGLRLIDRGNAVAALFRCLRRGKNVALLCDLDQEQSPAFVDFFGVPAATVRTPAVLALRTGKPLLVVSSWSTGRPLDYDAEFGEPIVPDATADPAAEETRLLREMNRQIERFVRAHPEQWNWIHPRWKTRPPRSA